MKLLVFHIGPDRYGLPLKQIRRVLPLMELKQVPLAPPAVAGLMNLHGQPVPVIDLARLAGYEASAEHFDTRIVLSDYTAPGGAVHALGLLAERVLGVQEVNDAQLMDPGVRAAPFLGKVSGHAGGGRAGMVQLVVLDQLLPPDVRAALFPEEAP
ncbi:chemotaxis protein CheW [Pseudoduganella ginsengisoli]|uniref:Chemotaxis protein CheW n=1 Tax=Pseudoduganella ginsengisoli TaxID=1462440 RepID=A0A6L6Q522_9BURK|nr:chemotaxis protein CheW [Pseudoduganella ginsengisoli]MTW04484.1 chemotaxis protein CheW [Pseudoduganella ginsengisoli]